MFHAHAVFISGEILINLPSPQLMRFVAHPYIVEAKLNNIGHSNHHRPSSDRLHGLSSIGVFPYIAISLPLPCYMWPLIS